MEDKKLLDISKVVVELNARYQSLEVLEKRLDENTVIEAKNVVNHNIPLLGLENDLFNHLIDLVSLEKRKIFDKLSVILNER